MCSSDLEHGVRVTDDVETACIGADLVLLAVKPQDLPTVAETMRGRIGANAVLVSIAAGVRLEDVQRHSGHRASVRVMPNLPAAIGEGAAVFLAAPEVTAEQRANVRSVLNAVATAVIEVSDDDAVDLATAVHGSGPAYVYLMIEAMIDAAVRLGMKRPDATALVLATVDYLFPLFREACDYPALLEAHVHGNPERLSEAELREQAWDCVAPELDRSRGMALAKYRRLCGTGQTSDNVLEILPAAYQGKIETLFINPVIHQWGRFDSRGQSVVEHANPEPGDDELVNLAAMHTFESRGEVVPRSAAEMPSQQPLAAIYRY